MAKLSREDLKRRFKKGSMPTEADFANLIDSMLNILEEGFHKSAKDGLVVSQLKSERLISFFEDISTTAAKWWLDMPQTKTPNTLHFCSEPTSSTDDNSSTLTLRRGQVAQGAYQSEVGVGVHQKHPKFELDVNGVVASRGRVGEAGNPVPADGEWHDITEPLEGCSAYEIVAGVGAKDSEGKYAMLRATALNTFGKGSISAHDTYFGNRCNRLELRWNRSPGNSPFAYVLQLRVRCNYGKTDHGEDILINHHKTLLWVDTWMTQSLQKPVK